MCPNVFWCEAKYVRATPSGIGLEDCDDVQGTDRLEPLVSVRIVSVQSSPLAPMFTHTEEDFNSCLNQAGCCRIRLEVRVRLPSDWFLQVVQGKYDLGGMLKVLNWGVIWEESIPNKEGKVHARMELDCMTVTGVLGVLGVVNQYEA